MALEINATNFDEVVLQSDQPVLVDFWAQWCGPCKMISPLIDELATEVEGSAKVGKVEMEGDNQQLAVKYGVRSIPCLLFFKDGEVKDQIVGANITKDQLKSKLTALA